MKVFSIIYACFLLIFIDQLQAEESNALKKHPTRLDRVEFQTDVTYLYLSDGTVYSTTLLSCENEILKLWNTGDHITVEINMNNQGTLVLVDLDSKIFYFPQVTLESISLQNLPTIEKIEKVRNLKCPSIVSYQYKVLLSDGSYLETSFYEDLLLWKEGDRIIISISPEDMEDDSDGYVTLINCDLIQTENFESGTDIFKPTSPISLEKYPTIQKIEIRKVNQWSSHFTAFLTLSDGSCWKKELWNNDDKKNLEAWFAGDHLIIDNSGYSNFVGMTNYNLISTDTDRDATIYFESVK